MGVDLDASVNADEVVVDVETELTGTVEFGVSGTQRDFPIHIVFCVDKSGSMAADMDTDNIAETLVSQLLDADSGTEKIEVAKAGVIEASQQLSSGDQFGVVAFNSDAETVVGPTDGSNARSARSDISSLTPSNGTDIQAGLRGAKRQLDRMGGGDAIRWIVLVSDGKGNVPSDRQLRQRYSDEGITIQAAGVGDDYDPDTLMNVAQQTQGESEHIKSASGLERFFQDKVSDARGVVALDPELRVEPTDIASIGEVHFTLGEQQSMVDPEWRGDACVVDLADVNQDAPPKVMLDLTVDADRADLDVPVAEATLTTKSDRASDRMLVDVVTEHLVEDISSTRPAKTDEMIVSGVVATAQEDGPSAALRELESKADLLSSDAYRETEAKLEKMQSDDSGEAADEVSRLPSKIDD